VPEQTQPAPDSPRAKLQEVRRALAQENYKQAKRRVDRWLKQHPNHPSEPEAVYLRGESFRLRGRYFKSLYDYERLVRSFPASEYFLKALERELWVAEKFISGTNRRLFGLRILPAEADGQEILTRIQERAPGSELGMRASLLLAESFFAEGDMATAATAYDLFLVNYPEAPQRERALRRLIEANLARFKGPRFDATGLIEAKERIRQYRRAFPAVASQLNLDALLVRIDESLARKMLYNGRWYERRNKRLSAEVFYRRLVKEYPTTNAANRALGRLSDLLDQSESRLRQQILGPEESEPTKPAQTQPALRRDEMGATDRPQNRSDQPEQRQTPPREQEDPATDGDRP
jgi:outer membrane assembly lipoprotein YfiO